jgi:hypothetical protein
MADDEYTASDAVNDGQEGVKEQGVVGYSRGTLIGGSIAASGTAIAGAILSFQDTLLAPVRAFTGSVATFISGTIGAPVIITDAGAETSATSFLSGTGALLGPLAFPAAVLVSALGMFLFLMFLRRISVSPTQLWQQRQV